MKKENKFDMIFGLTKDDHVTDEARIYVDRELLRDDLLLIVLTIITSIADSCFTTLPEKAKFINSINLAAPLALKSIIQASREK